MEPGLALISDDTQMTLFTANGILFRETRVAPMGSRYRPDMVWSREKLDREGAEIAAITYGHSLGYIPAAVLTHIRTNGSRTWSCETSSWRWRMTCAMAAR